MTTHNDRSVTTSLWMTCLLCLFVLTVPQMSSGQHSTATDLSGLVSDLKDKKVKVRAEAARLLTGMGEAARPAVPALIDALEDSDAKVRYRALIALGNLWSGLESGPEIEAAVPAIVKLLKDKDEYTRRRAIHVLRKIGPGARNALPALKQIMNDRNDPLWVNAFGAVNHIERPATDDVLGLAGFLKDKDAKVRAQAAERLYTMGMREALVGNTGFKGEAAIPALIDALKDPDSRVRYHSLSALTNFMSAAERPDLGPIIPTVTELLQDAYSGTRWHAALLLGQIGPRSRTAVPLLTQALEDNDATVRGYAAYALGAIGPESRDAVPSLLKLLQDANADVREPAAKALAKIDASSARVVVPTLSEDLKHEKIEFRGRAARALGSFGPGAKPAVALLADMLKIEEHFWRHEVVRTLEKIGPAARDAVPALRNILNDRVAYIRVAAAVALLKIAPESESEIAVDLLKQAKAKLEKDEEETRKGGQTLTRVYNPDPGTKWDEAIDLLSRGVQFYKQGNLDAALASFTEAVEIDPKYADAYHSRGTIHRRRANYAAAIADFTKAIESDYRSNESHYIGRGVTHMDRGDYDAAIADFSEIIKVNHYNAEAYYGRGLAYHWKGNLDAAVTDYDRAIDIVPPETRAFTARGSVKLIQGKIADALADLEKAVKTDPTDAASYEYIGDAYSRMGDQVKARDAWAKALSLSPESKSEARLKAKLKSAAKQ